MTTEEREEPSAASVERACERCGDFAELYTIHTSNLCEACVERLPDGVHAPASAGKLLGSLLPVLMSVPAALPLALAIETVTEVSLWVLHVDHVLFVFAVGNVASSFAQLALVGLFHASLHGKRIDVREAWRRAAHVFPRAAVTDLQSAAIMMLACLALLVPGLYLTMRWMLTTPVMLYEGLSGPAAMKRSAVLVDGVGWDAFICLWAVMLPPLVLGGLATGVHEYFFPGQAPGVLPPLRMLPVDIFFGTWTSPGIAALVAVVYANRRFHVADAGEGDPAPYPASSPRANPAP